MVSLLQKLIYLPLFTPLLCQDHVSIDGTEAVFSCQSKRTPLWQKKTLKQQEMQGIAFGTEKLPRQVSTNQPQ